MSFLRLEGVSKRFSAAQGAIVQNLCLEVEEGDFFVLLGPSGCGKTTTLRMIAGLTKPDQGEIWLKNNCYHSAKTFVEPNKRSVGLVFQDYALFPHLNVEKNIGFGISHLSQKEREMRVNELLDLVQMRAFAKRSIQELSGGEQQRIALVRSIARQPELLLLDEPFGNLDAQLRADLRLQLKELFCKLKITCFMVTHEQEEALQLGTKIAVMNQGKMEQIGTAKEVYERPCSHFVAHFMGKMNVIAGHSVSSFLESSWGKIPLEESVLDGVTEVCIRPEGIALKKKVGSPYYIDEKQYFGATTLYFVCSQSKQEARLQVLSFDSSLERGEKVEITFLHKAFGWCA